LKDGEEKKEKKGENSINSELAKIRSVAKDWIPDRSYNYNSLEECQALVFEVKMSKILSYKGLTS
jgi:hypothetical protein